MSGVVIDETNPEDGIGGNGKANERGGQRVDADATGVVIIKMSDGTARKVLK